MSRNVEPTDVWLRVRFQRWRLPADYPPGIPEDVLLRQVLKRLARTAGWAVVEMFGAGQADPRAGGKSQRPTAGEASPAPAAGAGDREATEEGVGDGEERRRPKDH